MRPQDLTLSASNLLTKRIFCVAVLALSAIAAAPAGDVQIAETQDMSVAAMDLGSLDDLAQSINPRTKVQRAAPNTWSARFETRFNARWGTGGRYMV